MKELVPRPYVFGPIEFCDLNQPSEDFDAKKTRDTVVDTFEETHPKGDQLSECCAWGYRVQIKQRTLKRPGTVLKHSRFMANLVMKPVDPPDYGSEHDGAENEESEAEADE